MNSAVGDVEELDEFGDISDKSPIYLLLSFYSSHYFFLFFFVAKEV